MIQKKYYKKLFLHIRGYIQFERFFNETTEYQLLGCFGSGRVFRLASVPTLRRSHTAVQQMATRNVGNVLLLRNQIKLTLTAAAGFVGGPVFSSLCESGANVCSLGSRKTTPKKAAKNI